MNSNDTFITTIKLQDWYTQLSHCYIVVLVGLNVYLILDTLLPAGVRMYVVNF